MQTAPVIPREPPTTRTSPEANLVDSCPRRGASPRAPTPITPAAGEPGGSGGIPIGATTSSPVRHLPGATRWPTLAEWKLTVRAASIATPATSPVEASTPEATSQATIGAPAAFAASIAASAGSRGAPSKPVPKIASMIAPEPASASSAPPSRSSAIPPSRRSRFAAASSLSSPAGQSSSTSTSWPADRRWRAATSPSPPLFPLPQRTRIGPSAAIRSASRATAPPAVSMSWREEMPRSSIAQESTARIASASRSGSSQSGRSIAAEGIPREGSISGSPAPPPRRPRGSGSARPPAPLRGPAPAPPRGRAASASAARSPRPRSRSGRSRLPAP